MEGDKVCAGGVIGLTGNTGFAEKMITIETGAHLHFELRNRGGVFGGMEYRADPMPLFLNLK